MRHVHNFYIQNIRNNKNHRRTPKWIQKYGLVDTSEIKRKERRSQWANRYNERLPRSTLEDRPYEEGQEGGSSIDLPSEEAGARPRNNTNGSSGYWDPREERYYGQNGDASSVNTAGSGRWRYPANFEDAVPEPSRKKSKKKKEKKDRWARTEDAYSVAESSTRRRKSKKKSKGAVDDDTYSRRSESTTEFPEDPEGGLYGDRRPAGGVDGEGGSRDPVRTTDDVIFNHELSAGSAGRARGRDKVAWAMDGFHSGLGTIDDNIANRILGAAINRAIAHIGGKGFRDSLGTSGVVSSARPHGRYPTFLSRSTLGRLSFSPPQHINGRLAHDDGRETCRPLPSVRIQAQVAALNFAVAGIVLASSAVRAAVLVDFQVAQPPPLPQDAKQCTIQILHPPTDCGPPGSWAGISLNFTVTSNGTQFDRLVWRTSTPEPTRGDGIIWTYLKDVTRYTPLFAKPGTFILQLDNLLETGLDGQYATTLHATFFASSERHPPAPKADVIIPVSTLANDTGNEASVPPVFSLNVTVPRNAVQIFAEMYASGNGNEEFWYFNTANEFVPSLPSGTTFGDGPFREVRMLVDGQVAGVAFPPITSYGALDLPTYFIDLTPFVPVLTDGNPHNISLDVVSAEEDHAINQNWFVSGNLQVVTDSSSRPTTGKITKYDASPFAVSTTTGSVGDNGDVNVTVSATRNIHIEAEITSGSGKTTHVVWSQNLEFSNTQQFLDNTFVQALTSSQNVFQTASGTFSSTHNGVSALVDTFSYPLNINLTVLSPDGSNFVATFDHSYDRTSLPAPFILGSTIHERQLAMSPGGFFQTAPTGNTGNGTNSNTFSYVDLAGNTYDREVTAVDNNITSDHQGGTLAPRSAVAFPNFGSQTPLVVAKPRLPGGRKIGD
ncbi:LOW QUALITY PROTEIN: hypothetical protein ACG7TL_003006 [Trametes sanguinea]